jgi:hypothetical protein
MLVSKLIKTGILREFYLKILLNYFGQHFQYKFFNFGPYYENVIGKHICKVMLPKCSKKLKSI